MKYLVIFFIPILGYFAIRIYKYIKLLDLIKNKEVLNKIQKINDEINNLLEENKKILKNRNNISDKDLLDFLNNINKGNKDHENNK